MEGINFSFIIPHKDIPNLLVRCLASIPRRPDVQIIVVDDNSDPRVVDFAHFPGQDNPQVEVVLSKEGRGAGYARNVGLERAVGKWIVFADADDYYLNNLPAMLDRYVDDAADMIIFRAEQCVPPNDKIEDCWFKPIFDRALSTRDYAEIKQSYCHVIARFIKRELIGSLRFQVMPYAEDVMFCLRISLTARRIEVADEIVYRQCLRPNSNVRNTDWRNFYWRTKVRLDVYAFMERCGDPTWQMRIYKRQSWKYWWDRLWPRNRWAALSLLPRIYKVTGCMPLGGILWTKFRSLLPARRDAA